MTKPPEDLIYAVDDVPPWPRLILLGGQYAALLSVYLILIVVVVRAGGATQQDTINAVSLGMVAAAIGSLLQAIWRGPVGSGFLAAPVFSAIYLGPSMLASSSFGLGAVFGMTIFAGLVEIVISRFLSHLRVFFPPAISGFIVVIVGIQLGLVGIDHVLNVDAYGRPDYLTHVIVSLLTLAAIVGLSLWAGGLARLMCASAGILFGLVMSVVFGLVPLSAIGAIFAGPAVFVPDPGYISYDFEWVLVPAFLIAGIAAALRTVGVITTCQKINDTDWKRPDLTSIKGGMLADGIGCIVAGLLGTIGQNTAPSLVGVSKASGATSRYIAFSAGAILILLAFVPAVGALFLLLPKAVIGAALVFTSSFMISGGIQIMVSRNIDSRMTYVIGIAMLLGLGKEVFQNYFKQLPHLIQPLTGTMLSVAVVTALSLHLLFRLGARRTATFKLDQSDHSLDDLEGLLTARGNAWGIDAGTMDRAVSTTRQVLVHIEDANLISGNIRAAITYNDVDLVVTLEYSGTLLNLPNVGVHRHIFFEEESFSYGLADFLTGVYPDRMESSAHGSDVTIRLIFAA
ncbi:MAG: xanthine/uracil/vitamin C permease [Alphaproteobacteria bacterium]|nr:xanthine/uracil/vitamin C permease [Alphaproteobacteria bacterium]